MNRLFYMTMILGLLLMILNIYLDLSWIPEIDITKESLRWALTVISKMSSSVGLALILGNLTKLFNKKDEEEIKEQRKAEKQNIKKEQDEYVKNFTKDIQNMIMSKDFLNSLSIEEKKSIIANLLTPNNNSLNKYSNIKEYLDIKSDKYLNFFNINFRSHMQITVEVYQKEDGYFYAKFLIDYRIYKINNKYEPIKIYTEKEHSKLKTTIKDNGGKHLRQLEVDDLTLDNGKYIYIIPEEYEKYNFLRIERTITEKGNRHWISVNWRSLTPIDGITFKVNCHHGIIKEYQIFDNENFYENPDLGSDRKYISIKSSQWLDPYTGISVLVALPSADDNFKIS